MIGILVVTHGNVAAELADAGRKIVAKESPLVALALDWDDDVTDARRQIAEAIAAVDRGAGVLILTDMFGGTPTNLAMTFYASGKVEVVTGVNLPMLVKALTLREDAALAEAAQLLAEKGRSAISVAGSLLGTHGEA
jgi:PTS system mannose-specific IIA component